jgi:hypothetical protein
MGAKMWYMATTTINGNYVLVSFHAHSMALSSYFFKAFVYFLLAMPTQWLVYCHNM